MVTDLAATRPLAGAPGRRAGPAAGRVRRDLQGGRRDTADLDGMLVNIAVSYGGRHELRDAVRSLLAEEAGKGTPIEELAETLDIEHIAEHLYTKGQPDPDLIIRTSGEQRLSGLLDVAVGAQRVLLLRGAVAGLPQGRLHPRAALVRPAGAPLRPLRPGLRLGGSRRGTSPRTAPRRRTVVVRDERCAARPGGDGCTVNRRAAGSDLDPGGLHPADHLTVGPGAERRAARTEGQIVSSASSSRRTYVIDTSVLLSDPQALRRFAEHDVVLPVVVITELEAKRHHAELGYFARTALRHARRSADRVRPA